MTPLGCRFRAGDPCPTMPHLPRYSGGECSSHRSISFMPDTSIDKKQRHPAEKRAFAAVTVGDTHPDSIPCFSSPDISDVSRRRRSEGLLIRDRKKRRNSCIKAPPPLSSYTIVSSGYITASIFEHLADTVQIKLCIKILPVHLARCDDDNSDQTLATLYQGQKQPT